MDGKFYSSLHEGDSANGVKLGMGLTGGVFWPRINGCQNLYRGESEHTVDFEDVLTVAGFDEQTLSMEGLEHAAGKSYVYVLRRANICGQEEHTFNAAARISFDGQGELVEPGCNDVFGLYAEQVGGMKVRLVWFYSPLDQRQVCSSLNVYGDGGSGQIDYQNPLLAVGYKGPGFYEFLSETLAVGKYLFCVNTVSVNSAEAARQSVEIEISGAAPDAVKVLEMQVV